MYSFYGFLLLSILGARVGLCARGNTYPAVSVGRRF
jgi:hypothetical protein